MASYQSIPAQYNKVVEPLDVDLMGKVLMAKEGQTNANIAQIDETLGQLKIQENMLIGDQRKARFANNVQTLLDEVNRSGKLNLQSGDFTRRMKNYITTALDDYTLDHISKANSIRAFQADVVEKKKKGDGSYNDANYAYSAWKGGLQEYVNEQTDNLGNLVYTPYTDLTEEALKSIKTIKDIKGKRYFEEQAYDENGNAIPGKLIRREIDGLTPTEIQNYFGSTLTSQQLTQMKINGWAKYAQPQTKDLALEKYKEFNNLSLKQKEDEYQGLLAESKNPNKDKATRERALKLSNELKETIDGMKNLDYSKIDPEAVGFELEKMGFVNGLSQMAGTEWSTEYKTDDYYFDMQKLDIDRQQLELAKRKEVRESGVDENGNPILDGVISTTPASTELAETLSEEQIGAGTLKSVHDDAYNKIVTTARKFLANATKEDKTLFEGYLAKRGITPDLKFKDQEKSKEYSLANTIYEAFRDGGFNQTSGGYASDMQTAYKLKQESAKNIITSVTPALKQTYDKNPDSYINALKSEIRTATIDGQSDTFSESAEKDLQLAKKAQAIVDSYGGWNNIKQEIDKDPDKLRAISDVLDELSKRTVRTLNFNFNRKNLKEDSAQAVEEQIQKKTKEGVMMSAYTQSNILDEKLRAKIIGSVSEGEVTLEDGKTKVNARFDPKKNLTVSREGDEVVIRQVNDAPTGEKGKAKAEVLKYKINPQSSAYAELSKYINLQFVDNRVIKATKDTNFQEVKPQMRYHTDTKDVRDKKVTAVALNFSPQLSLAFDGTGIPPVKLAASLATKDTAEGVIEMLLKNRGVEEQKAKQYTQKLLENVNNYRLKVISQNNIDETGYDFAINVTKPNGSLLFRRSLGVGAIDTKTDYLLDNYPQIFILNQKIKDVLEEPNRIDTLINEL